MGFSGIPLLGFGLGPFQSPDRILGVHRGKPRRQTVDDHYRARIRADESEAIDLGLKDRVGNPGQGGEESRLFIRNRNLENPSFLLKWIRKSTAGVFWSGAG